MLIDTYPIIRSMASYILPSKLMNRPGSGGTFSAEYCYSVWMRHLRFLIDNKLFNSVEDIKNLAEIGPGDSLGIGLSAIFTGAKNFYAFDQIKHANLEKNIVITEDLVKLFSSKHEIPNTIRQVNTHPKLKKYDFPNDILSYPVDHYKSKQSEIEKALKDEPSAVQIKYQAPWMGIKNAHNLDLDLIISQAVMEHVSELEYAYSEMYKWLKVGGVMSHQIDFKAHEMSKEWNGHWYINKTMWEFLLHGRKYPINRYPMSTHVNLMKKVGFEIKFILPVTASNTFGTRKIQVPNVVFDEQDMVTSGALIQAVKCK